MYTKGADPELFLKHKQTGEFISSVGLIGGSKEFPRPIGNGCAVQEDNVTVEFNIPPCKNADEFIKSINYNKDFIKATAEELGLELCIQPSAIFKDDQLTTSEAKIFGCDPDFNAWLGGKRNPSPRSNNPNLRSAGGHIHIEIPPEMDIIGVVKAMDLFVGCPMLEFDSDTQRREMYGKAGAFRKKSYGVEYRTASNAWIMSDDRIKWVWDQTEKAIEFAKKGYQFTEEQAKKIQGCINNSDLNILYELKQEFSL